MLEETEGKEAWEKDAFLKNCTSIKPIVNNDKKRFGRRAGFAVAAVALITVFAYFCMFKFSDPEAGLKWFIVYSVIVAGIFCLTGGLLTLTDIKSLAKLNLKK